MSILFPTPHGDKLNALLVNEKLPDDDRPRVSDAINVYESWLSAINEISEYGDDAIEPMIESLNQYKRHIDIDLIFDSSRDFLYRQKGQLKLDNTILEEFLPYLVAHVFPNYFEDRNLVIGPATSFSHLRFSSNLTGVEAGGGMAVRSKDHDFVIARPLFLKASHDEEFIDAKNENTHLAYIAAEIKTNLDKTMFQEASGTAHDLKLALPNSRYLLLCEWLDMKPISTAVTAIEEVIILRKARRIPADVRRNFASSNGRKANRGIFVGHVTEHPFDANAFRRFLHHVKTMLVDREGDEKSVLARGWF